MTKSFFQASAANIKFFLMKKKKKVNQFQCKIEHSAIQRTFIQSLFLFLALAVLTDSFFLDTYWIIKLKLLRSSLLSVHFLHTLCACIV